MGGTAHSEEKENGIEKYFQKTDLGILWKIMSGVDKSAAIKGD